MSPVRVILRGIEAAVQMPEFVRPYAEQLRQISETDENRVVRSHCSGAVRATGK